MTIALRIAGLCKRFGARAVLDDLDLELERGHVLSVLGASGSGKTTLLRLICGFDRPDAGTIEIGGRIVCRAGTLLPPEKRRIGYVAQDAALFPHLNVADNITFGLPRPQRRARYHVQELLNLVGLPPEYADRAPHSLSGGEQQRVALARALAPEPDLILLDEPFSALDTGLRYQTRQAVVRALQLTNATALLVTHDQAEALSMGDRVAILREGRWAQIDKPEQVYRAPVDLDMAGFVGDSVVLPATIIGNVAECALGQLPLQIDCPNGPAQVMVRPEQIKIGPPGRYHKAGRVISEVFHGAETRVTVRMDSGATITVYMQGDIEPAGGIVGVRVEGKVMAYPLASDPAPSQTASV